MIKIHEEDQYNDCYGRERMYLALQQRKAAGKTDIDIPCEATVRKVMAQIGLIHKPRRKPNGITKADRIAQKAVSSIQTEAVSIQAKSAELL